MNNKTITISVRINEQIWEKFRIECIKNKIQYSTMLEKLIKQELIENEQKTN